MHARIKKPPKKSGAFMFIYVLLLFLHLCITFAAINRPVLTGTERNFCIASAGSAGCGEHLSVGAGVAFAGVAAILTSLGLVYKAPFRVEFLLASRENKF